MNQQAQDKINKTEYLVEATSYEVQCLWEKYGADSGTKWEGASFPWKEKTPGYLVEIGTYERRPVALDLRWVDIGGALICFYSCPSRFVDHELIESFLKKEFPGIPSTDSMGFFHVIEHIRNRTGPPVTLQDFGLLEPEAVEAFREKGILNTMAFELSALAKDNEEEGAAEIYEATQKVCEACGRFQKEIWEKWLHSYYREASDRGHHAQAGNLSMMVYGLAGRVLVTLRFRVKSDEDWYVSLMGYDGPTQLDMGVRGAYGTVNVLRELVDAAIYYSGDLESSIRPDSEVGLLV